MASGASDTLDPSGSSASPTRSLTVVRARNGSAASSNVRSISDRPNENEVLLPELNYRIVSVNQKVRPAKVVVEVIPDEQTSSTGRSSLMDSWDWH